MKDEEIRKAIRERYGKIAIQGKLSSSTGNSSCCIPQETGSAGSCCVPQKAVSEANCCAPSPITSQSIGYSIEELGSIPDGADLGLGCGNPTALASLKEGEVVLDLGSGAGIDCFLAASKVGKNGRVIGVDMTPEMLERARENAKKGGYTNVDFRLGEIENLPVADNAVDAVISNCVINLSTNKGRVFREVYRVLKPGGRMMVSDIVLLKELPEPIKSSIEAYVGCIAGASRKEEYLATVATAGFQNVEVVTELSLGTGELAGLAASINVCAIKPN